MRYFLVFTAFFLLGAIFLQLLEGRIETELENEYYLAQRMERLSQVIGTVEQIEGEFITVRPDSVNASTSLPLIKFKRNEEMLQRIIHIEADRTTIHSQQFEIVDTLPLAIGDSVSIYFDRNKTDGIQIESISKVQIENL